MAGSEEIPGGASGEEVDLPVASLPEFVPEDLPQPEEPDTEISAHDISPESLPPLPDLGMDPAGEPNPAEPEPFDLSAEPEPGQEDPSFVESSGDPAADVEALLAAALMPPEGQPDFLPEAVVALPEVPTFQLRFRAIPPAVRADFKKALEAAGVSVPEKLWEGTAPVLSQLTEFQAVVALQSARSLGLGAEAGIALSHLDTSPALDEALGSLADIAEGAGALSEGAPRISLAKGERDVMLCSPDEVPGVVVHSTLGIILAHRSMARRLFREEELRDKLKKELRNVPGVSGMPLPSSHLQIHLRDLMLDLRARALALGANCVLGVKLEVFTESKGDDPDLEQLRLVAFGTAAVVEKT